MKLLNLLALATLTAAIPSMRGDESWSSETKGANATALLQCVDDLQTMLEAHPRSRKPTGYRCADYWWQYGGTNDWQPIKNNLKAFNLCERSMLQAVSDSKDWYQCKVTDIWGFRIFAWSPWGMEICSETKDHSPCRVPRSGN